MPPRRRKRIDPALFELPVEKLRGRARELRELRPDARVVLRIGVYFVGEPRTGQDERGRHALAGPSEWLAEQLAEYVEAGCNGFVVNLDHLEPGLEERIRRFAEEVAPLYATRP